MSIKKFGTIETCFFCGKQQDTGLCVEGGWQPYFYVHQGQGHMEETIEIQAPVCEECSEKHLVVNEDGEWEKRIS